ncbi:ExeA family protein [Paucimonas lemoignei]|nr:ExeA family protein [Paucimonas lemoignei]
MYTHFFQLKQAPFSIAPDPRYLFMSERHREALAHLLYGVDGGGGFVLLTGEIGAGKTTICRCFLEQIPAHCQVAYIFNPKLSVDELLQTICDEFHIDVQPARVTEASVKQYVDALNAYLLQSHAEGKNNVLIIDEAQNLTPEVLEQLRLLTNLETSERKLLQVILIGQPELRSILARPELEQLAQRIIARYHLDALSPHETAAYIQYRLSIAGAVALQPFPPSLTAKIHRISRGVPRRINLLCDRALLGAYAANSPVVTPPILNQAAREVFGTVGEGSQTALTRSGWRLAMAGAAGIVLTVAATWGWQQANSGPDPAVQAVLASQAGSFKLSHSLTLNRGLERHRSGSRTASSADDATPLLSKASWNAVFSDSTRSEEAAFRLLGQEWGMAIAHGEPCTLVQERNLRCYRGSGGLEELRRLHRPAILKLTDSAKQSQHALLVGLSENSAELRMAGRENNLRISLEELSRHFQGEFVTFWRTPPGYAGEISLGDKGEAVDWINAQLSRINGGIESIQGEPYGAAMVRQVKQFQQAQGLVADGIAGARTLMLLNRAAGVPEPRLRDNATLAAAYHGE